MRNINIKEPDYGELSNWAASPHKPSLSDVSPGFILPRQHIKAADVFFIHPTTYICSDHGHCSIMLERNEINRVIAHENREPPNAATDDKKLNAYTDRGTIRMQASAFNDCGRIFAPRYRQAHLKMFFLKPSDRVTAAFDLAYGDIKRAFEYYLDNEGGNRPIIIAGHSQGSLLGIRLLREFFDGTALQKRLVCAYLPGFHLPKDSFIHLPLAADERALGGFLGWRSYQRGRVPVDLPQEKGDSLCVNPLVWTDTMAKISIGRVISGIEDMNTPMPQGLAATIEPQTKVLLVDLPPQMPPKMRKHQNLHLYDYSLFWLLIRENAIKRTMCFLEHRS